MITVKIVTVLTVKILDFFVYEGFLKFKTTLQSYTNDFLRRNVKRNVISVVVILSILFLIFFPKERQY